MITVNADDVQITNGANYQFIGTGSGTAAGWRNVAELAGNGLTATNGVLAVGAGTLMTVAADTIGLSNGTAQYQVPVTGATPFTPTWTDLATFAGAGLAFTSGALRRGRRDADHRQRPRHPNHRWGQLSVYRHRAAAPQPAGATSRNWQEMA